MAEGLVKEFPGLIAPVVEFCLKNDINIMQMPCPETLSPAGGLGRSPHGKVWYEAEGLRDTAREIARSQVDYMARLLAQQLEIIGIIGVEFSPACGVKYLNKGRSIVRAKGIYVEELERAMTERAITVPIIGISQRWKRKMVADLEGLLELARADV
jgi:predicted secreted protein